MRKRRAVIPVALAMLGVLPLLLIGTTAVTAAASPAPITIAYITTSPAREGPRMRPPRRDSRPGWTCRTPRVV
jgi:hypothetical protein